MLIEAVPAAKASQGIKYAELISKFRSFRRSFAAVGEILPNYGANNVVNALRLKTTLALQEAGILDNYGCLTQAAMDGSELAIKPETILKSSSVVKELTKDGSRITDWTKMTTPTITLFSGQRIQIHYYQNKVTGEINYTHHDYKVKGIVNKFYIPNPLTLNSQYIPLTPQDILNQYKPQF